MSKITRRTYKRNKVALGLALFAGIGLISTGFAAFIISANSSEKTGAGVNIGVTKNQTIKIDITSDKSSLRFDFEPKLNDNGQPYSFIRPETNDDGSYKTENLTINITGVLSNILEGGANFDYLNVKMATNVKIDKVIQEDYIVAPECYSENGVDYRLTDATSVFTQSVEDSTKYSFSIPVTFTWGTKFDGENPAEYYEDKSDEVKKTAQSTLDTMRYEMCEPNDASLTLDKYLKLSDEAKATALKQPSFEITLTAVVK